MIIAALFTVARTWKQPRCLSADEWIRKLWYIYTIHIRFSSVQSLCRVWLFATPWIAACQSSLSITNSQSLLKLMPTESVMPSSHLILCHPLLLLPPIPPSIRVFSNESNYWRWPKYWSFSLSISPSNEHLGLISFRVDWLDFLAVQGTLKLLFSPTLLWCFRLLPARSMGFLRQEYWNGLSFPSPGNLIDPGIELMSLSFAGSFLTTEPAT